jgi:NMD protein affecting ribosome stability and mRNA decay
MTIHCSVCGHQNPVDEQVCEECGAALVRSGVSLVGDFEIRLCDAEQVLFRLEAPYGEGYVIGRTDEASDYTPDVDLAEYGAREQGVSRRHAALVRYRGTIHIVDLNSVNGTFLNGRRLTPEIAYPLNVGDALRIGNMNLAVSHT